MIFNSKTDTDIDEIRSVNTIWEMVIKKSSFFMIVCINHFISNRINSLEAKILILIVQCSYYLSALDLISNL